MPEGDPVAPLRLVRRTQEQVLEQDHVDGVMGPVPVAVKDILSGDTVWDPEKGDDQNITLNGHPQAIRKTGPIHICYLPQIILVDLFKNR